MYRVFDKKRREWIREGVYISPEEDVYISKKSLFGTKLDLVSETRYIWQKDIGIHDKNGTLIFEGDIVRIEEFNATCIVAYTPIHASYHLFDYDNNVYYPFDIERISERIEVVGCVFDDDLLLSE